MAKKKDQPAEDEAAVKKPAAKKRVPAKAKKSAAGSGDETSPVAMEDPHPPVEPVAEAPLKNAAPAAPVDLTGPADAPSKHDRVATDPHSGEAKQVANGSAEPSASKPGSTSASPSAVVKDPASVTATQATATQPQTSGEFNPTPADAKPTAPAASPDQPAKEKESAAFRRLKEGLNATRFPANLPMSTTPKFNKHKPGGFGPNKGRNQVYGANVNRTGVPRRTSGG